ncbi:MAG TPA: glycoside hydrolase family 15 protein [Pyrinomonadaceae bacterium]|jgi:GH15 family glucan-1,4-alpha-glucosidase|nr:glycoside hydrolase family 15 protein [Pyrinomonadaceae bacterium]
MTGGTVRGYRPIRDYALIGDAHTAALVARDGSIDWCCWPRFDSPAVFCRLLDAARGGWSQICPAEQYEVSRSYVGTTNVLAAEFKTGGGRARLTDFMPVERLTESHRGEDIAPSYRILRLVEGLAGSVEMEVSFRPTFDYACADTVLEACEGGAVAHAGREALTLTCAARMRRDEPGALAGRFKVREGERVWFALNYFTDVDSKEVKPPRAESEDELRKTLDYWEEWWHACRYDGQYSEQVRRSALVLKLLTYEPTGALVAAPTTSLPEEVGGVRNWDYRYTWLRDSSLILYTLMLLGYQEEASDFFGWLDALGIPRQKRLQIMYTLDGKPCLPERKLEHLEGYRGSRPVRVGNAAFNQKQLDVYGEVLDAVHLYHERARRDIPESWWDDIQFMAARTVEGWREPDSGIWEVRGDPRHFLYSKLMCWVALDRAVRLAGKSQPSADVSAWKKERDAIRELILREGYNERVGAFTQYLGGEALDASALIIPQTGFLPPTDVRVKSTVERISERLTSHGLVYRYLNEDGLPGGEGTFALCSFWLVDNLAAQGRVDEAKGLFEKIVGYANDLGLLSEEIDPVNDELLGNYPQGFSHLALIRSALNISRAEADGEKEHPQTSAEQAEDVEQTGQLKKTTEK